MLKNLQRFAAYPIRLSILIMLLFSVGVKPAPTAVLANQPQTPLHAFGVLSITPDSAPNDLNTPVNIQGTDFVSGAAVYLDPHILGDINVISDTEISASIPWGLNPGTYALRIVNPDEAQITLDAAFTVTAGLGVWNSGGSYGGHIAKVVQDPVTPTTMYLVMDWPSAGLFRSTDSGSTWTMIYVETGYMASLAIDPTHPSRIYTTKNNDGAIVRSEDSGATWTPVPIVMDGVQSGITMAFVNSAGTLYGTAVGDWMNRGCGLF